jgi:hypothetical protein
MYRLTAVVPKGETIHFSEEVFVSKIYQKEKNIRELLRKPRFSDFGCF